VLWWVLFSVVLGVAGLAVLAALGLRLWRQIRRLTEDLSAANERLARASDELQRLSAAASRR
jgi:hypothetical protein